MKVYIAGKINGDKNYKRKFSMLAQNQREVGNIVLNPAELPEGMLPADYMRICLAMIDTADMVLFMSDWISSRGAAVEMEYCSYINKPVAVIDSI